MLTNDTYTNTGYDPVNGSFWRVKKEANGTRVIRKLIPNENQMLTCVVKEEDKEFITNRKAANIAWHLANGNIPDESIVLTIQPDNYRLSNLVLLSKEEYIELKDSEYNIENTRITYYGSKFRVNFRNMNRSKYELFEDEETAKAFRKDIISHSRTVVSKYD